MTIFLILMAIFDACYITYHTLCDHDSIRKFHLEGPILHACFRHGCMEACKAISDTSTFKPNTHHQCKRIKECVFILYLKIA